MPDAVTIGRSTDTGHDLALGDIERRSGLYVLGKPGMGKTTLLVNLILKDIAHGHGVFFLDPHGDAVDDILKRSDSPRLLTEVVELDPQHPTHTFSINLLACKDIASWRAREDTYARARAVFWKLFENDDQATWLPLVLQNTLYAFIESPGYSLADVPEFLDNPDFRNHILSQVKYNTPASDFFRKAFHPRQAQPLRDRLSLLLGHPPVRHIVGQPTTTVDFAQMMQERKILLIKLSANLAPDQKRFIGMILVSELLQAVRARGELPPEERHQFCIFVDEFQNFVSSEDFAALINEGRKFAVATTIAHQERYGQLAGNRALLGATAAAANKVYFQLASEDARELALDFARTPPTEPRLEPQLVISQNPISDLLRGHANPQIRGFVTRYLRPLQERLEDIKADMDEERLFRDDQRDLAALDRVEGQMEALRYGGNPYAALQRVMSSLLFARAKTAHLFRLHQSAKELRSVIRGLNRFLSAIMEGNITHGQEQFSQFLIGITRVREFSLVPEQYASVLELYISLQYGDPATPQAIPFNLAQSRGLFSREVMALKSQALSTTEHERLTFRATFIAEEDQHRAWWRKSRKETAARDRLRAMKGQIALMNRRFVDIRDGQTGTRHEDMICREDRLWYPPNIYTWFIWLSCYPNIEKLLISYRTAQFTPSWKFLLSETGLYPWSEGQAAAIIGKLSDSLRTVDRRQYQYGTEQYMEYMSRRVIANLKEFLHCYQEGALVMLALLDCAGKGGWRSTCSTRHISLSDVPAIEGKDPVEVWCLVERLRGIMREALGERCFSRLFIKYLDNYYHSSYDSLDDKLYWAGFQTSIERYPVYDSIKRRDDVQSLETLVRERWDWFAAQHAKAAEWWRKCSADPPIRYYLLCRAADLVSFGEMYQSLLQSAFAPYEEVVGALVSLSQDTTARHEAAEERQAAAQEMQRIEAECAERVAKMVVPSSI
jgi:hypothetical protein